MLWEALYNTKLKLWEENYDNLIIDQEFIRKKVKEHISIYKDFTSLYQRVIKEFKNKNYRNINLPGQNTRCKTHLIFYLKVKNNPIK